MTAPAILLVLLTAVAAARDDDDPKKKLVDPLETVEKLWDKGEFTEGGAAAADGSILFSDIGDRIMRFHPITGQTSVFRQPSGRANGMIFDPEGRLIVAEGANGGGRRVSVIDRDGERHTLAKEYKGKRFNSPNDVAVDKKGRVYFTDPRYVGDEPRELDFEGVFRIDDDGDVERLETTAKKPNGIAVSPDGETLYVADTGPDRRVLLAMDLDDDDGDISDPRVLVDFGGQGGIDGMTVDVDGRIVAATPEGVVVFSHKGKRLALIPTPEPAANVEFGGDDASHVLYIMAGKSLYRIHTKMSGYHVSKD